MSVWYHLCNTPKQDYILFLYIILTLWIMVDYSSGTKKQKMGICGVYLPSPAKLERQKIFIDKANDVMNHVSEVVILGDFNIPKIHWNKNDNG